jgi:hypothetical protein
MLTVALVTPPWPALYTRSDSDAARTCEAAGGKNERETEREKWRLRNGDSAARRGAARRSKAHLRQVGDAQHKANGVEHIALARAVQACACGAAAGEAAG